ncbi:PREDICTED: probable plastid-lipid-associated protein 14, chloroplastic [Fragaria vesca subsp. vesca]|uniref:probable plastid-lipid-associated protein 14, chloroplastic n=1 Tax=Fragaria vesca subsp. vesca TaxID=101020 RepID=UPI0002C2F68B|nr:PREDICTED: probable plastid-lipid-associated protein 14, chloroplastic [Fragaria vesca subsp. vesca]XP_011470227.1 PREDICTED: probable plastid-lipid-associated protein 14, chloroplastic [Fragaria vesca subsp. vesca]
MALCGIGLSPGFESFEAVCAGGSLSTRLIRPSLMRAVGKTAEWKRRPGLGVLRCSSSSLKFEENVGRDSAVPLEEESGHVIKFKMSDFKVLDRVSVGLGGKAGEVVYEAIVSDTISPLYSTQVVLRRLTSVRAQRRGRRAIEVLKKLVRRRLLYHSYSMQVHGYISSATSSGRGSFTLVHGYHGSFSLRHWLQQSDWLPTLEATLALDKESVRKVGDDTVGGPAVSRQLRMIRLLMRDLLIGVNYLHSHGLAHTELRLENVHISPVDRHIKVGILGNTADFYEDSPNGGTMDANMDRRQMMIAFDMRCLGFMMAKMVLQELMDPSIFSKFKSFLTKGNDPSCLREFLLQILHRNSSSGNAGLQILDRNWGAGWHLLSLLLATKPSKRISCLDALTHPFLCGPRWRVVPSIDIIRWGLGSTALRISEEYIYGQPQRNRLSHFIELMEMLNPHSRPKNWLELLPGKWRILYSTGRHIGLTFRQPLERVLIGNVHLTVSRVSKLNTSLSFTSDIGFRVMVGQNWPHDKTGVDGKLQVNSIFKLKAGRRLYLKEEENTTGTLSFGPSKNHNAFPQKLTGRKWRKAPFKEFPSSLPVAKLISSEIDNVTMSLGHPLSTNVDSARNVLQEVRTQVPTEMFDLSKLVCGTYVDSRLLVIRGVNGSALLFTRSCFDEKCK